MRRIISFWSLILIVLIYAGTAAAVKTSLWEQQQQEEFEAGTPKNLSLTSRGDVMLAPKIEGFTKLKENQVWALVEDSAGNLYAATGNEGKIYKISAGGDTAELYYDSPEVTIYSLAVAADDTLYAGTGPDGLIYKITDATTPPQTMLSKGDKYVWALRFDDAGNLYAATGTDGKIYKITPEGESSVLFDAEEKNIMALLMVEDGFYAGSSNNGIIYRVTADGTATVIYQAKEKEVRDLAMDSQGNLYAAVVTSAPAEPSRGRRANGPPPPPSPPPPGGGPPEENASNIYKIRPDGTAMPVWNSPEPLILAIVLESDTQILVGTGDKGKLYRVNLMNGDSVELGKASANQILAIHQTNRSTDVPRTLLATGNTGSLFTLTATYVEEGTLTSQVHNAQSLSRWGKLSWEGEMAEGTAVAFATRSGKTRKPDDTWSPWSDELTMAEGSQIASPDGQYIQWRAKFTTSDTMKTPVLKKVTLASVQTNIEPKFTSIEINDGSGTGGASGERGRRNPGSGLPPPGMRSSDSGMSNGSADAPAKKWKISWKVEDANEDTLQYTLYYKAVEETNWKRVKKELSKANYEWDITTVADGRYTLKVVATDKLSNPVGWAKSAEKVSQPFDIDNTQPAVGAIQVTANGDGSYKIACEAMDAMSPLKKAVYKIDDDEHWKVIFPEDGIFDSKQEQLLLETDELEEGAHTIIIQVTDRAQNIAVGRASF